MKARIKVPQKGIGIRILQLTVMVQVSLLLGAPRSFAHQGERIYPFYEITDYMLELIDLEDGSIEEWEELFEPSLTTLDFTRKIWDRNTLDREIVSYDPSDLDFRIWMAWNDKHERLYVAGQFADDIHVRKGSRNLAPDYMWFHIDGDHTGGEYYFLTGNRFRDNLAHAQTYTAPFFFEPEFSLGLMYNTFGEPFEFAWAAELPYGFGRDGAEGENPVVWNVEFFITPFDLLDPYPENSMVSELESGKVIGFYIGVGDSDLDEEEGDGYNIYDRSKGGGNPSQTADAFVDGVLLRAGEFVEGSAVQPSSWGMIKASLSY